MIEEYYKWFLPGLSQETDNEIFMNSLLACEDKLFISCIGCALLLVFLYYGLYTKRCFWGYHYRVKHWVGWIIGFFIIMTAVAWLWPLQELEEPKTIDIETIQWRLYWGNVVLYSFTSLFLSWFWCQFLPTNAYRFLKIRH